MTKKEIYEIASNRLLSRRQSAIEQAEQHYYIAVQKIPEIADLKKKMAQSTIDLSKLILSNHSQIADASSKIMQENLAAQKQIKELLFAHHFPLDYLDISYSCSKCEDTGYVKGERCECLKRLMKQVAAEELNHSTYLSLSRFEDFQLNFYQGNDREQMSQIFEFCQAYANHFTDRSPNILMTGNTGLGKTHLSLSIANEVLSKGFTVLYGMGQDFFEKIQNEHFGKGEPGVHTMASIMETDLFIMDDIGAEYESNFNTATFYNIINTRLNIGKPTILNTNLSLQQLASRYGDRVGSRLMTLYKCLKFTGIDIRQQILVQKENRH